MELYTSLSSSAVWVSEMEFAMHTVYVHMVALQKEFLQVFENDCDLWKPYFIVHI